MRTGASITMNNPNPDSGELIPASAFSGVQVLALMLCFVVAMIDGFDILIIAYTAPAIIQEWNVPSAQMGLIFSAGLLGMTLGSMLLGSSADVYGRRIAISLSLLVAGICTCAVYWVTTVNQLAVLRFVSGLGLGTLLSALPTLTREYSPSRYRNVTVAVLMAGTSVGGVVGGLISAALIADFGWRAIFLWAGVITLLSGAVFHLVVPESLVYIANRGQANALERINKTLAYLGHQTLHALPRTATGAREAASVKSLLTPSRRGVTLLAWSSFFLSYATIYFLSSWLPKILVDSGLSQKQGIQGTVVMTMGAIAGTVAVGWLSKRWRLNLLIACSFVIGCGLMVLLSVLVRSAQPVSIDLLWALIFLIGLAISGAFSNLYSVSLMLYPPQVRSTGLGWCIGLGRGGAVVSPMIAGLMIGAGISASDMLLCFAVPAVVAAACIWSIKMREMS